MSDTPRTDAMVELQRQSAWTPKWGRELILASSARELERENNRLRELHSEQATLLRSGDARVEHPPLTALQDLAPFNPNIQRLRAERLEAALSGLVDRINRDAKNSNDIDGLADSDEMFDARGALSDPLVMPDDARVEHCPNCQGLSDAHDADLSEIGVLRDALQRARGCIKGLLARTPVRDVEETLAEIDAALVAAVRPLNVNGPDYRPMGDNHHNALACPYCNPKRLKFADDAPKMDVPSGWIRVGERLPEPRQSVALVNINRWEAVPGEWNRNVHQCGYIEEFDGPADQCAYWSVYGERALRLDAFTHWMPLPAPPDSAPEEHRP